MLTTVEAAKLLNVRVQTIRKHIKRGNITTTKHGRDHFIAQEEFDRFLRERRKPGWPKKAKKAVV